MALCTFFDPTATGAQLDALWITPSKLRPLFYGDPAVIWLEHFGADHGMYPETQAYSLMALLEEKGQQFERAWIAHYAPDAIEVCAHPGEAQLPERVRETLTLMQLGTPVIAQPALWHAEARLYGAPDLIVHTSWLQATFPDLAAAAGLDDGYAVLDLKFSSKLEKKREDLRYYAAQVRLYTFMLAAMQGTMPAIAFLATRDQHHAPLQIPISSRLDADLDADLADACAAYRQIVAEGATLAPWRDACVAAHSGRYDERWAKAKLAMQQRVEGGSVQRMWNIGITASQQLMAAGIANLQQLLAADPATLPRTVLRRRAPMLAILEANRTGRPRRPHHAAPPRKARELIVDCEFFSSINVDFEREWPDLAGCPMIFMIGVGWRADDGAWCYRDFIAAAETHAAEAAMLMEFHAFLQSMLGPEARDAALYHWSNADRSELAKAADRHALPDNHLLRRLPWVDVEAICVGHACAVPGAWGYSLKGFVRALAAYDPSFDPRWPSHLDDGSMAQVMGWHAYRCPEPLAAPEMATLREYLEADCRGVHQVLCWLRDAPER